MDSETTEGQAVGDGVNKDILAPAEGPRENLISTAIKFLQNPKVVSSPLYQKKAFLEKKGLTQEEIELAIQRAGVTEAAHAVNAEGGQSGQLQVYRPGPVGQPQYAALPPQSGWAKARDLTMTTVVVASISYAVYQLFQVYVRPWLVGKTAQERRIERLEQEVKAIHNSIQDSLSQISRTLAAIQTSLAEQQQQTITNQGELRGISDLKSDVASLKGLMLSKNQFPALPSAAPVLPSWQRSGPSISTSTSPASSLSLQSTNSAATAANVGSNTAMSSSDLHKRGKDEEENQQESSEVKQLEQEEKDEVKVATSSVSYVIESSNVTTGDNQIESSASEISPE